MFQTVRIPCFALILLVCAVPCFAQARESQSPAAEVRRLLERADAQHESQLKDAKSQYKRAMQDADAKAREELRVGYYRQLGEIDERYVARRSRLLDAGSRYEQAIANTRASRATREEMARRERELTAELMAALERIDPGGRATPEQELDLLLAESERNSDRDKAAAKYARDVSKLLEQAERKNKDPGWLEKKRSKLDERYAEKLERIDREYASDRERIMRGHIGSGSGSSSSSWDSSGGSSAGSSSTSGSSKGKKKGKKKNKGSGSRSGSGSGSGSSSDSGSSSGSGSGS